MGEVWERPAAEAMGAGIGAEVGMLPILEALDDVLPAGLFNKEVRPE